mgnify:FL=1
MNQKTIPLLILPVIWGSYYVASHEAARFLSAFPMGIMIRLVTLILLTVLMWRRGELSLLLRVEGAVRRLLCIGMLGFLLDATAFIGLSMASAGLGTALLKCDILFVNLISVFVYHQKFTKFDWIATFVMLFGVVLVLGLDPSDLDVMNFGNVFFILSALFVAINAFVIKSVQTDPVNPISDDVVAYYNNLITMVLFIIASLVTGHISQLPMVLENSYLAGALVLSGIGQTLIYVFYYYNLRRFPVWLVKIFLLLMPIVSALISFVLFGETMSVIQCAGIAIVLVGAIGILAEQRRQEAAK